MISEEFVEYCRFGHVYDRDHLITSEAHDLEVVFPFADFGVERLADDIVLVSYVNTVTYRDETARVRRSSIWIRQDESWLLKFQQATTLPT